mmetsp:Transcript_1225/g.1401  ORF Transcript_1225/g.1401 Transcript_1225/m.1401 type:complete len:126 (-) Transcript_1225:23-400(-)
MNVVVWYIWLIFFCSMGCLFACLCVSTTLRVATQMVVITATVNALSAKSQTMHVNFAHCHLYHSFKSVASQSIIQISCISVIHSNQLQIEHHIGLSCCEAVHAANGQDHRKVKKKEIWKIARKRA